ncbi:bacillithiol biosynthesis deacetylase BshB2, partial [Staphylococcus aureus]|nr:bacillithiol biosynthesis deacetylase BshB2 [Staphylococcus aureus]
IKSSAASDVYKRQGPFLKQLASPEIDGKQHSFLTVEPYWTYHFKS